MTQNARIPDEVAIRQATHAIAQIGVSTRQAAENIARFFTDFAATIREAFGVPRDSAPQQLPLHVRRRVFAGNGSDAHTHPDQWQSAVCSAWLHDSCPSDQHGLGCTCHCHRSPR